MNSHGDSGVFGAARSKATSWLAIAQTRLDLLRNELEVGRITIMRQLMLALALAFCVGLGLVLTVIALTLLFWEQRLLVVSLSGAVFWAVAVYLVVALRRRDTQPAPLFSESLAELQEDLRQLKAAADHGRTPG